MKAKRAREYFEAKRSGHEKKKRGRKPKIPNPNDATTQRAAAAGIVTSVFPKGNQIPPPNLNLPVPAALTDHVRNTTTKVLHQIQASKWWTFEDDGVHHGLRSSYDGHLRMMMYVSKKSIKVYHFFRSGNAPRSPKLIYDSNSDSNYGQFKRISTGIHFSNIRSFRSTGSMRNKNALTTLHNVTTNVITDVITDKYSYLR